MMGNMIMTNIVKQLDIAMEILTIVFSETSSSEIGDCLDMLSEFREQYIEDNSQFGVGA